MNDNVIPLHAPVEPVDKKAALLESQKAFLRSMLLQLDQQHDEVAGLAFAFMVRFEDGSVAVQASGFSSDAEAQRYFEAVMRNRLAFSS